MWLLARIRRWLHEHQIQQLHRHHRVQNPSTYVDIDAVLARFRSAGGLKHDFQPYKLFQLRQLLERYRPTSMLELGSGSSTAVFAAHIRKYGGRLCSVDESASWLANAMKLSGIEEDDNRFEMRHCPAMIGTLNNLDCVGYGLSAEEEFDLIFVDGPSLRFDGVKRRDAINDDVFRFADCCPPRMIVVDGRYATVRALEQHLQGRYEVDPSALIDGGAPGENYNYFSIFRRNINQ
jgi:hypothetical protein